MAETLLRHIDSRNFEAFSAGPTRERGVHPLCVEVMKEVGMEMLPETSFQELPAQRFDLVITLDELSVKQNYAALAPETIHWKFQNPSAVTDSRQQRRAFLAVRDQIAHRIRLMAIVHTRAERVMVASAGLRSYTNPLV